VPVRALVSSSHLSAFACSVYHAAHIDGRLSQTQPVESVNMLRERYAIPATQGHCGVQHETSAQLRA